VPVPSISSRSPWSSACCSHTFSKCLGQSDPGIGLEQCLAGRGFDCGDHVVEQGIDELVLVGEAPVNRADADPGVSSDIVEGRAEAAVAEDLPGGRHDPLPVQLGDFA
jgi:hypothetical protein